MIVSNCVRAMVTCCLTMLLSIGSFAASSESASGVPVQLDAKTRKEVVESLASRLEKDYAHADIGAKMSGAIRKKSRAGGYNQIASMEEFARVLQADVRAIVNDKHLRVSFDPIPSPSFGPGPGPAQPRPPMPDMRKANGAIHKLEILPGNIGYMEVNGVPPMANEAIDAAFAFLRNTDALILDLRGNGGGAPDTVAYYMSYLSEGEPYPVMRIQTRHEGIHETRTTDLGKRSYGRNKPVFALISYMTFSGGEEFAYDLQAVKRATIVGEVTGGGANPGTMQPLGHGFVVFLPYGYGVHPATGTSWEGIGVKPDVPVPARLALTEARRLAVERLAQEANDPMQKQRLGALAQSLARQMKQATPIERRISETERQLLGAYGPIAGFGPSASIVEKDGGLMLQPSGSKPASALVPIGEGTYQLEGLPESFIATFIATPEGKVLLSQQAGGMPAPLMQKR